MTGATQSFLIVPSRRKNSESNAITLHPFYDSGTLDRKARPLWLSFQQAHLELRIGPSSQGLGHGMPLPQQLPTYYVLWASGALLVIHGFFALSLWSQYMAVPKKHSIKGIRPGVIASPKERHPFPTESPYPPDLYPGARDVSTPYGSMHVYEWGPVHGRKILLICGGATPSPMLGPLAQKLVEFGCRVILYDLWARGYSDCPTDAPHDKKLYTIQILYAITSSPISWTGDESGSFSIVGYSLGGGIAMAFAADFAHMLNHTILLAPAGILRNMPQMMKGFKEPDSYEHIDMLIAIRPLIGLGEFETIYTNEEMRQREALLATGKNAMATMKPNVPSIIQWQYDYHHGFPYGFVSSLLHGPIQHQHEDWKKVAETYSSSDSRNGILVIFGEHDSVVNGKEVIEDMETIFKNKQRAHYRSIDSDHEFPFKNADEVASMVLNFLS